MPYELPQDLSALSADDLQALLDQGLEAFHALGLGPDSDDATIAEGERIAPLIKAVADEQKLRQTEAKRRGEAAQGLLDSVAELSPVDPEPEPEPEPEPPEAAAEGEPAPELEPVAAAVPATRPARRAAANSTLPVAPLPPAVSVEITAAADVPGFATGSKLDDLDGVVAALINRMKGISRTPNGPNPVRNQYGVATIRKQGYGDLTQASRVHDDYGLVAAAGNEKRLPGGSLTAAGGWCAPSETLYDMCQLETIDGILSIPEFQVNRGGINWTSGPDFEDIYTDCGFEQTEAQAIAGDPKTCCIVDCPPFEEIRLDAVGLCVKSPILTESAYPELTRRFLEGAMVAHAHKMNARVIADMVAAAGAPQTITDQKSIIASFEALFIRINGLRYKYRLATTASIEIVAPLWAKDVLKAAFAMRGDVGTTVVNDAQISAWFAAHNCSVQWVYDWQNIVEQAHCNFDVPATLEVLVYPAGTWAKGVSDVINLNGVYDSSGLECNVFTALFMEEGILTVQKCTQTCLYHLTPCASGAIGARTLTCLTINEP